MEAVARSTKRPPTYAVNASTAKKTMRQTRAQGKRADERNGMVGSMVLSTHRLEPSGICVRLTLRGLGFPPGREIRARRRLRLRESRGLSLEHDLSAVVAL